MEILSIIFFILSVLSVILSAVAFLGKLPGKGKDAGIVLAIASGIFGICELVCIWNSPKGLFLIIGGVILVSLIFIISKNEGEQEN